MNLDDDYTEVYIHKYIYIYIYKENTREIAKYKVKYDNVQNCGIL